MSSYYWSATTGAHNTDYAWRIYFDYGGGDYGNKSNSYYVRAVRSEQSIIGSFDNLVINGDGTVTDKNTGLVWQQETEGEMDWQNALSYCESLSLAGKDDWRLPTVEELRSIVDYNTYSPAADTTYFDDIMSSAYWSGTTDSSNTDRACYIYFDYGNDYGGNLSLTYSVRAVRSGQSITGSFDPLVISITASSASGYAPFQAFFSALTSGGVPPYQFTWNFGDGTAEEYFQDVTHTFTRENSYTVTLQVTDGGGATAQDQITIIVTYTDQSPTCSIVPSVTEGDAPLNVSFSAQGLDPEGGSLTYSWNFGDEETASGSSTAHVYYNAGTYSVTLIATDEMGNTGTSAVEIHVSAVVPDPPDPPDVPAVGKAIIIAGGGAQTSNTLFQYTTEQCRQMYDLLKQRGYSDGDICYMTPQNWQDIDGDGRDDGVVDYQLFDPLTELEQAFDAAGTSLASQASPQG